MTRAGVADDGQADLDKAMELKVQASTLEELSEVVSLCEKAIEKGLNADDQDFAVRLLTGTLYQRVRPQVRLLVQAGVLVERLETRRKEVLTDLRKIIKYDEKFGQAYLMIAQLEALKGGDREEARKSVERAIELLEKDKDATADALLVRGKLQETEEARLADFDRAVELSPKKPEVWQIRASYFLLRGEVDKAVADFEKLLEQEGVNPLARLAIAETLLKLDKIDEAMDQVNKVIEVKPNANAYRLRALLYDAKEMRTEALADVEKALQAEPDKLELILMRARLYHLEDRNALAKTDIDRVLNRLPDFAPALELRSSIEATMGQYDEAVRDISKLLKREPGNVRYKLQLAIYQTAAGKSAEAIKVYVDILKSDPGNGVAFRGRADAYLNIGDHKRAIADYEVAMKSAVDDSGILNNFAWVLATSPDDDLRDGKRAVELALNACELTEYKAAHILSTLAAAYAETGDFENALKWSTKAVELEEDQTVREQLEGELESYKKKKPWRERKSEETDEPVDEDVHFDL